MWLRFKEITLVGSNQGNFFENATACSKRKLKTTVATQLYALHQWFSTFGGWRPIRKNCTQVGGDPFVTIIVL